jgi:HPt (histidine-containing phosphotransfer) domain-containing protein
MAEEKIGSESEYSVFDKEAFLGRIGRNEALAQKIMVKFIDDVPKRMEAIRSAMEKRDMEEIRIQAHTIKGSSRNVGAERLGYYAERLEKSSASGDSALLEELVAMVQNGFEELKSIVMP